MNLPIAKIVSGGQTGADRGGLDAAIEQSVPHGGWCPKDRRAEAGAIPACYELIETESANYLVRTERNVVESHCTIVFTHGQPRGGSKKTIQFAEKHERPCLHVDLDKNDNKQAAKQILEWLSGGGLHSSHCPPPPPNPVVNVAGSRESKNSGIEARVKRIMSMVLDSSDYAPSSE